MTHEACAAQHFGWWIVNPRWAKATAEAYNAGQLAKGGVTASGPGTRVYAAGDDPNMVPPLYTKTPDGVAYVGLRGAMTKGQSSFGGTSNVRVRKAMRMIESDPEVKGVMLQIDSPGGTVSGQQAMADEIAKATKPVHAYVEDSMHSAALWAGVQAARVTASPMAEIGSIGVVAAVHDYSEAFAKEGIKVHVISTGEHKGALTPGTEVTEDQVAKVQERVDELNGFFLEAVRRGRGLSAAKVQALATGEDWMASKAVELGLIDGVETEEQAVAGLLKAIKANDKDQAAKRRIADARIRMAKL